MAEPDDMIIPMLREIQEEIAILRDDMNRGFSTNHERLLKIEAAQKSFKHALTTDTMMSKFMLGDYEERLQALETKVDELTKAKQ